MNEIIWDYSEFYPIEIDVISTAIKQSEKIIKPQTPIVLNILGSMQKKFQAQ